MGGQKGIASPLAKGGLRGVLTRRLRTGFGVYRRAIRPCLCIEAIILLFVVQVAQANDGGDAPQLKERVQTLNERVTELAGDDNLLDTLYFAWSDRPYARATLAVLIKVVAMLDREVRLREDGGGLIEDRWVEGMLRWSEDAIRRAIAEVPTDDFRPHRILVTKADVSPSSRLVPLFAFIDEAEETRVHPLFGDLDLLAALGQRVYPRGTRDGQPDAALDLVLDRARALGIAVVDFSPGWGTQRGVGGSPLPSARSYEEAGQFLSLDLISAFGYGRHPDAITPKYPAMNQTGVFDTLPGSLARRALLRGLFQQTRCAGVYPSPPMAPTRREHWLAGIRAMMWVHAFDGQSLGLIRGWRDVSHRGMHLFHHPQFVESAAHTALDMLRVSDLFDGRDDHAILALAIGFDALRGSDDWADWVQPVWAALLSRQIRFDIVTQEMDAGELHKRYRVVIPLRQADCGDVSAAMTRIETKLALIPDHVYRLTAREMDGTIASNVFVRAGRTPEGKACAAVVNLSDRQRLLKLRGRPMIRASRDVISNVPIPEPDQRLELAPWQVRLLWPKE